MRIQFEFNDTAIVATLADSPATRDFIAQLPLVLSLEDYAATEKIAYLPKRLSTEGAPAGMTPQPGDLAYYAPWGNLAIFHKGAAHASGLVLLGRIDSGLEALRTPGAAQVTIDLLGP
jgi:hypothetical protein